MNLKYDFVGQQEWPTNVVMPASSQTAAELIVGGIVAVGLLLGLRNLIKNRDHRLLICMIGGGLSCVLETHTMYMLKFFYPQVGQHVFLTGFGRPIPIFLMFMYSAFFGLSNYIYMSTSIARSFNAKYFWLGMLGLFVVETAMEVISINFGVWAYFDDQPLLFMDFPVHVAVICSGMSVVLGSLSRIWFDRVKGLRQYWLLLLYPVMMIASFEVFVFPLALGISSDGGLDAARIGSIITIALTGGLGYQCAKWCAKVPRPS